MLKKLLLPVMLFGVLLLSTFNSFASDSPKVRISTNMGDIELQLDRAKAPQTVQNFLQYAEDGFYTNTVFHRVIKGFMIQGGGFTAELERKQTRQPIANEAFNGLKNNKGTIAMARTNMPHSASSQFFINTAQNDFLNFSNKSSQGWGYTVFGRVIQGMDIVEKIENLKTGPKGVFPQDVPQQDIIITGVEILSE